MKQCSVHSSVLLVFMIIQVLGLVSIAEDFSHYQDADTLWRRIQEINSAPQSRPASQEEARKAALDRCETLDNAISAFSRQFPDEPHRWDAKIIQLKIAPILARLRNTPAPRVEEMAATLNEVRDAGDASESAKKEASFQLIQLHSAQVGDSTDPSAIKKIDDEIRTFIETNPGDQRIDYLNLSRAKLNTQVNPEISEAILKDLTSSTNKNIAAQARAQLRMIQLMRQPLDLDFQAVDGQAVSLKNLRGKVVLVDFWATWCGPCMREAPNVVATYKQLRDHGFEIVGISLDQDLGRVRAVTEQMGMTWPQYCDGKGWQNEISSQYGIQAIPTTWILDKRGYVRYVGLRGKVLSDRIQELQAE
jgi:thiol-disulfide isomerase/thioredoxin